MTKTPAPDPHPDLADLEAMRTGEAGEDVRRHVDGCARCAALRRELEADAAAWAEALAPEAPAEAGDLDRRAVDTVLAEATRIRRQGGGRGRLIRLVAAAAAVLVLAAGLSFLGSPERAPDEGGATAASPLDVDGDGAVDIVDAYLVARRVRAGEADPARLDMNDDGAVDAGDVDLIARAAVALDGGNR